ncbi:MAG: hypothetical protein ACMXX7_02535, partial [Candidatus Woesearchaeota archaeon]
MEYLRLFLRNTFLVSFLLLLLTHFELLGFQYYFRESILVYVVAISFFGYLFFISKFPKVNIPKIKIPFFKLPLIDLSKYLKFSKYFFLLGLLLITISSLKFEFLTNIDLFKSIQDFILNFQLYLTLITIGFGFLTFYLERDRIEKEIEKEQIDEEKAENKREKEFDKKYPFFAKFNLDYNITKYWKQKKYPEAIVKALISPFIALARIPYTLTKWMYKEGWKFSIPFVIITTIFLIIRIGMPILYTGSYVDEYFHIVSGMSLIEEGKFPGLREGLLENGYKRGANISYLVALFINFLGYEIFVAKLVPIFLGLLSFIFLFFILKIYIKDKNLLLISLLLFTLNYYTVFNNFYIRMYVFYEFALIISIFLWFSLINNINRRKYIYLFFSILCIFLVNYINYYLSYDNGRYIILFSNLFLASLIFILYDVNRGIKIPKLNYFINNIKTIIYKIIVLIILAITIFFSTTLKDRWRFFFESNISNYAREGYRFYNLFFETNLIFTILFILAIITLFYFRNNIFYFMLGLLSFTLFL